MRGNQMDKKTFYITTPIYYTSGKFHIGTAYTTCLCDTMKRYKSLMGYDTRFLTGTDEHGMKIAERAKESGITPQEYVDRIAGMAKDTWKLLDIHNDDFIRTTEKRHETIVADIFEQLLAKDDIYLGEYSGNYCMECEAYFTPTQLLEGGLCPDCGRPTTIVKEETYFLRLSKYQDRLLKYIDEHPDFIFPETRKNEVVQFVKTGLQDLSVSRTAFEWGIKVKSNPKHVIYVWIDALTNYITALGYGSKDDSLYKKYWENGDEVVHVVGKDILRFHAVYWPIMLMALDLPIKFRLFVHGWYMMKDGKMSKSKGNVIYPDQLTGRYGLDSFRYYILRELPYGNDGLFTPEDFISRVNTELANDYGNLVSRSVTMVNKYFDGLVRNTKHNRSEYLGFEKELESIAKEAVNEYRQNMDAFRIPNALAEVTGLVNRANKLIDETSPWNLAKNDEDLPVLESVLYHLLEALRVASILYIPFMDNATEKVFDMLGADEDKRDFSTLMFGIQEKYIVTNEPTHVFPRIDAEKETEVIRTMMSVKNIDEKKVESKPEIEIDLFDKVEIKVGLVKEAAIHKNAKKLLVLQINTGDKSRQVVSGIAEYYAPEELIGKKLLVVTNLKPVKLRGEESQGMILCGETSEGKLYVIEANPNLNPGDGVR